MKSLEGQEEIVRKIVDFAHALLEDVKGGFIAGLGLLILFYTIIKILSHIENALQRYLGNQEAQKPEQEDHGLSFGDADRACALFHVQYADGVHLQQCSATHTKGLPS